MGRWRWLVAGVAVVVVLGGGAGWYAHARPFECPASGCSSTIVFDLTTLDRSVHDQAGSAEVCFDGRCTLEMIYGNRQNVRLEHPERTVGSGVITISDPSGVELQRLELTHEVEGDEVRRFDDESCLPTCWVTVLGVQDGALEQKGG